MNWKLIGVVFAAVAVAVSAGNAAGAGGAKKCGNSGTAVQNIQAIRTTCTVAKKVGRADIQGKKYDGWKCTSKRTTNAADVTCTHRGGGRVTFVVGYKP